MTSISKMETIDPRNLLLKVVSILDNLGIDYFVTGGFAITVWGRIRTTNDIDMVIQLVEPQIKPLAEALRKISSYGYIDEETAAEAVRNNGEFNFIDPDTGYKVDFFVAKKEELSASEFRRKKTKTILGERIYFISPEDLILSKLRWYKISPSSRHIEDIESILKISGDILDKKYLLEQSRKQETWNELNKLLN